MRQMTISNPGSIFVIGSNELESLNKIHKSSNASRSDDGILIQEDAAGYRFLSFHLIGIFDYSATITFEISNDGVNWVSENFAFYSPDYTSQITFRNQTRYPGFGYINLKGRYFRLTIADYYEAGEIQVACHLHQQPFNDLAQDAFYNSSLAQSIRSIATQVNAQAVAIDNLAKSTESFYSYPVEALDANLFFGSYLNARFSYADVHIRCSHNFVGSFVCEIQSPGTAISNDWEQLTFYKALPTKVEGVSTADESGNYLIILPVKNGSIRLRVDSYTSGQIEAYVTLREGNLPQQIIYLTNIYNSIEELRKQLRASEPS
jgi:hypothetical protein